MSVPSFPFLAFALSLAVVFNFSNTRWWRQLILLIANVYMIQSFANNWQQLLPFVSFLILGYIGVALRPKCGEWISWLFLLAVFAVFVWLKRYLFVPSELLLPGAYVTVGLSYVFFRVMHLIIDGWEVVPTGGAGLISYFNYTLNFTSLVSGPIQRYEDYRCFETETLPLRVSAIVRALERILTGFFKVYILSSFLDSIHSSAIEALPDSQSSAARLMDSVAIVGIYPVYLYLNFSGYTDFVVGIARLFRIELPENFDRPFAAGNIILFWSRWHMSLTQWLRTYVYSPLLLTLLRRFPAPFIEPFLGAVAYFVTFFLVGFWHGQTSEFLFFGLLQGGGVAINKLYQTLLVRQMGHRVYAKLTKNWIYASIMRGFTFTWFTFTLLWFWSSWKQLHDLASLMSPLNILTMWFVILIAATVALTAIEWLRHLASIVSLGGEPILVSRYTRTAWSTTMSLFILVQSVILSAPAPQIVYKAF